MAAALAPRSGGVGLEGRGRQRASAAPAAAESTAADAAAPAAVGLVLGAVGLLLAATVSVCCVGRRRLAAAAYDRCAEGRLLTSAAVGVLSHGLFCVGLTLGGLGVL